MCASTVPSRAVIHEWLQPIAFFILLLLPRESPRALPLEAYASEMSVHHGDTLELHIRSEHPLFHLTVQQQKTSLVRIADLGEFPGVNWTIPDSAWQGCQWPITNRVVIPESWNPGAYMAHLAAGTDSTRIPFIVRNRVPGAWSPILVQLSTNTWEAYNRYGGKSLYGAYEPGLVGRAYKVSFQRPFKGPYGDIEYASLWEYPFISFLESQGYQYEICSNLDLHREPHLLEAYRLFVSVGHDEYYSKEMYDKVERFANSGGNLAFFSANTLWWQVRYEDGEHTLVCYKSSTLDPLLHIDDPRVTVNWHAWPVLRPPARLMGAYYNGSMGVPEGAYTVVDPNHWVYQGLQVSEGQSFGYPMVGFELDARNASSPVNTEVIARVELPDLDNGGVMRPAEMVYHRRSGGGAVFACGTVNYAQGIVSYYNPRMHLQGQADPVACAITNNVLRRLSSPGVADLPQTILETSFRVTQSAGDLYLEVIAPTPGIVLLHDVRGRRVVEPLAVGEGMSRFELTRDRLASGIYFATFRGPGAPDYSNAQRVLILQ